MKTNNTDIIEGDERYRKALAEAEEFEPKPEAKYRWVYEYAMTIFMESRASTANLEKKAQNIISFLAPGSGVIAIAIGIFPPREYGVHAITIICSAVALVMLGFAVWFAFQAMKPSTWTLGPTIRETINAAEYYAKNENDYGYQANMLEVSKTRMCLLMEAKATKLTRSFQCLSIAFLAIGIAALSACYFFLVTPPKPLA